MRAGVRIGLYPDENESLDARGEGGKDLDLDLDLDFNFYSSEASKPVKLLHGCVLGRRDGAGSGGLSAVLTGRTCLRGFELPLQISINSTKTKRRSKENDDMVSDRKIVFERSVCAADHWVSFISHVYMYVCTSNTSVPPYIHAFVCFDRSSTSNHPSMCVCTVCSVSSCAPFDARLAASLRLRAAATTAVQAAGFVFSTSHPDVGAHLGSRLL
jgi:hypothetical protein